MPYYPRGNIRAWVDEHRGVESSSAAIRARFHEIFSAVAFLHQHQVL
jgi:hypothetical protein